MTNNSGFFLDISEFKTGKKKKPAKKKKAIDVKTIVQSQIFACGGCPLYGNDLKSPEIEPMGENKLGIMIIGDFPTTNCDYDDKPITGREEALLKKAFKELNIDLYEDCVVTNVLQCSPPKNKWPGKIALASCQEKLINQINKYKPNLIITLGPHAIEGVLNPPIKTLPILTMRGQRIPSHKYDCWVACCLPLSYIIEKEEDHPELYGVFVSDIEDALNHVDDTMHQLDTKGLNLILNVDDIGTALTKFVSDNLPVTFDFEASSLSPFTKNSKLYTVALANGRISCCFPFEYDGWSDAEQLQVLALFRQFMTNDLSKIAHNAKFDELWCRAQCGVIPTYLEDCTMISSHILDGRRSNKSLGFQSFTLLGTTFKDEADMANVTSMSLVEIARHNELDARATLAVYHDHETKLQQNKLLNKSYKMYMRGNKAFVDMEERGVLVDVPKLKVLQKEWAKEKEIVEKRIRKNKYVKEFEQNNSTEFNPESSVQVGNILYKMMGMKPIKITKKGNASVDNEVLEEHKKQKGVKKDIKNLISDILQVRKAAKVLSTYIESYLKLVNEKDLLHPSFSLAHVITYRSKSSDPNFQNLPARDPQLKGIRECIIPRNDYLMEVDYKASEVRVLANYSQDKTLIEHLINNVDMHTKWGEIVSKKTQDEVDRDKSKNGFVFPSFYGAGAYSIAKTFDVDASQVEVWHGQLWDEYPDVKVWQEKMIQFYKDNFYIEGIMGFRRYGPMSVPEIINTPIQGTSFHLLLMALTDTNNELIEKRFKSQTILQVHDSIVFDVVDREIEDLILIAEKHLKKKRFRWQFVGMEVEWKIGKNWLDMEEF